MTAEELSRRLTNHNLVQIGIALGCIPASIFLWFFSFWYFRVTFYFLLDLLIDDAHTVSLILAWLCMIPLLIEGVRNTRPLFEASELGRSGFSGMMQVWQDRPSAVGVRMAHAGAMMFVITQLLYAAPRTMVLAIKAFKSRLPTDEATVGGAAKILRELKASRNWTPAATYQDRGAALPLLLRMELIWADDKGGGMQVRYPAGQK